MEKQLLCTFMLYADSEEFEITITKQFDMYSVWLPDEDEHPWSSHKTIEEINAQILDLIDKFNLSFLPTDL